MHVRAWAPLALLSLGLSLACFAETSGGSGGGTGGDTGGECLAGSAGCDCYGNGSCDDPLECSPDDKCLEPNCTPGALNCSCAEGDLCLGEYVCTDHVCRPPPGSTSDSGPGDDDGGTSTSGPGDGSATTGPAECPPGAMDNDCIECIKLECCEGLQTCLDEPECGCIVDCLSMGDSDPGQCAAMCDGSAVFPVFDTCIRDSCPGKCGMGMPCMAPPGAPVPGSPRRPKTMRSSLAER